MFASTGPSTLSIMESGSHVTRTAGGRPFGLQYFVPFGTVHVNCTHASTSGERGTLQFTFAAGSL